MCSGNPASSFSYLLNSQHSVVGPRGITIPADGILRAVHRTREVVQQLKTVDVDVFSLLGMRNLSAFVGEVFAAGMVYEHGPLIVKNPHQDGYPDLLLMDQEGQRVWDSLKYRLREKSPFSPFSTGGFEVKATCGSVPTPKECQKLNLEKPDLGDQRIRLLRSYDWKAHHRETNYLFGIVWDFIDGDPTIVAVFYRNDLSEDDWGSIVAPKRGGGRTTSVSIMTRNGVKRMYDGWLAVLNRDGYPQFFDTKNRGSLMLEQISD